MDVLYRTLVWVARFRAQRDGDFVDRIHSWYTPLILVTCSILVTLRYGSIDRIICWVPAEFTHSHENYANSFCWASGTYMIQRNAELTANLTYVVPHLPHLNYYQWVPMIFFFQACCFMVPAICWKVCNGDSGIKLNKIAAQFKRISLTINPEGRKKLASNIAGCIQEMLDTNREYRSTTRVRLQHMLNRILCVSVIGKKYGNSLACGYMGCKLLQILNCLVQLCCVYVLFADRSRTIRDNLLLVLRDDNYYLGPFPKVTMCSFLIRDIANTNLETVQCVLPINKFNQWLFVFTWLWFCLALTVTLLNTLSWSTFLGCSWLRVRSVKKHLCTWGLFGTDTDKSAGVVDSAERRKEADVKLERFVNNCLRYDGVLIIELICTNCSGSHAVLADTVIRLWEMYLRRYHAPEVDGATRDASETGLPFDRRPAFTNGVKRSRSGISERPKKSAPRTGNVGVTHIKVPHDVPGGAQRNDRPAVTAVPSAPPPLPAT